MTITGLQVEGDGSLDLDDGSDLTLEIVSRFKIYFAVDPVGFADGPNG